LANTPEGNRKVIGIMQDVEQRKIDVAKLARDYAKANNGRIDAGFDDHLAQWTEANPLFKAAPAAQPQPQQQGRLKPAPSSLINEAQSALKAGRDRSAIIEKMRSLGYDPSGL
jgi:hypothetical protein